MGLVKRTCMVQEFQGSGGTVDDGNQNVREDEQERHVPDAPEHHIPLPREMTLADVR